MAVYTIDRPTINSRVGSLAQQMDSALLRIQQFKLFLDTIPDATLISAYGYVQADIDVIRSSLNDLEQLRTIYQGTVNLSVAKDFRTFAKQLYAFGSI
jgi:hypothetical protein